MIYKEVEVKGIRFIQADIEDLRSLIDVNLCVAIGMDSIPCRCRKAPARSSVSYLYKDKYYWTVEVITKDKGNILIDSRTCRHYLFSTGKK